MMCQAFFAAIKMLWRSNIITVSVAVAVALNGGGRSQFWAMWAVDDDVAILRMWAFEAIITVAATVPVSAVSDDVANAGIRSCT